MRRLNVQKAGYAFIAKMWGQMNLFEQVMTIFVLVCTVLVFFAFFIGKLLSKYPYNIYFDALFVFIYLAMDPMPHQRMLNAGSKVVTDYIITPIKAFLHIPSIDEENKRVRLSSTRSLHAIAKPACQTLYSDLGCVCVCAYVSSRRPSRRTSTRA